MEQTETGESPEGEAPPTRTGFSVTTLSGHPVILQTKAEQTYYNDARNNYLSENQYTVSTDQRDLDRLLLFEVQQFAAQTQMATGYSFSGEMLSGPEKADLRRLVKETTPLISQIQNDLGLTRAKRDAAKESVGGYIQNLQQRAKEFGVMREKQLGRALELMNQTLATAGAWKRSSPKEREKLGFDSPEDVIDYILEVVGPQFAEVDEHFRTHAQKFWIRTL